MRYLKYLIIIALLWPALVSGGWMQLPGAAVMVSQGGETEYTLIVDQTVNDQTVAFSAAELGTLFTLPAAATDIRVTLPLTGASGTCEIRIDDDYTMSSEYIDSITFSAVEGSNSAVLNETLVSGDYFIIIRCPSGSLYRASTNVSADIEYRYGTVATWGVGLTNARDLTIKIEYK